MNVALHGLETFIVRELTRRTGKPITQALTLNTLMDLHLTADEIAILHGYTWGWVTHLQLAGLAGQGQSDKAGFFESLVSSFPPPPINDILDMILKNQSGDIRKFLLYTSLLDSLNVSLYEEVTRLSDCQAILMHLEQVNPFFLALNDERTWYRYDIVNLFVEAKRIAELEGEKSWRARNDWGRMVIMPLAFPWLLRSIPGSGSVKEHGILRHSSGDVAVENALKWDQRQRENVGPVWPI